MGDSVNVYITVKLCIVIHTYILCIIYILDGELMIMP